MCVFCCDTFYSFWEYIYIHLRAGGSRYSTVPPIQKHARTNEPRKRRADVHRHNCCRRGNDTHTKTARKTENFRTHVDAKRVPTGRRFKPKLNCCFNVMLLASIVIRERRAFRRKSSYVACVRRILGGSRLMHRIKTTRHCNHDCL